MLGMIEGKRIRGRQRMSRLDGIVYAIHMNLNELSEMGKDREAWSVAIHRLTNNKT